MGTLIFENIEALKTLNPKTPLRLVHDHGVYLFAVQDDNKRAVCYAKGCDPDKNRNWYDRAHRLVGGDDFAESIGCVGDHVRAEVVSIRIKLTDKQLIISSNLSA